MGCLLPWPILDHRTYRRAASDGHEIRRYTLPSFMRHPAQLNRLVVAVPNCRCWGFVITDLQIMSHTTVLQVSLKVQLKLSAGCPMFWRFDGSLKLV